MASLIHAVLVEDEDNSLEALEILLNKYCPDVQIDGRAQSVEEAIQIIDEIKPELVFLDIALPDGQGFEVLEGTNHTDFEVIFTTAYDQYALKAFEFSALDYLLKPINAEQLKQAVERFQEIRGQEDIGERVSVLKESLKNLNERIILSSMDGFEVYKIVDIIRCEANGSYTTFFITGDRKVVTSKTLNNFERLLEDMPFVRVHSKHLVNLNYIKKYISGRGGYIVFEDGTQVDVSERKKKAFIKLMKEYARST
ncbi:MAG: LytTR family DNA-binding domain-containing protein [Bacteroidota bacterium]|nr:LytTR family DNA-binding domain-containing protein [Bacteroidota bacterium]